MAREELDPNEVDDLFAEDNQAAPTKPQEAAPELDDPVGAYGVGLRASEWAQFDAIAAEMGANRHKVAAWALRDFLKRYQAGEIQTVKKPTLPGL